MKNSFDFWTVSRRTDYANKKLIEKVRNPRNPPVHIVVIARWLPLRILSLWSLGEGMDRRIWTSTQNLLDEL